MADAKKTDAPTPDDVVDAAAPRPALSTDERIASLAKLFWTEVQAARSVSNPRTSQAARLLTSAARALSSTQVHRALRAHLRPHGRGSEPATVGGLGARHERGADGAAPAHPLHPGDARGAGAALRVGRAASGALPRTFAAGAASASDCALHCPARPQWSTLRTCRIKRPTWNAYTASTAHRWVRGGVSR